MKQRKGYFKWIILLAALAALILLLTMCTRSCGDEPEQTQAAPAAETSAPAEPAAATEQTEETTEATQETTAPTEETTAPTEETTEPEEEDTTTATTAPDDDDDSEEDNEDYGEEEEYVEFPDPGTPENPYVEVLERYPAKIESVNIPKDTEVNYLIAGSAGSVITIEPGVSLTLEGNTYTADETTGPVQVDLSRLGVDPVIRISHSGTSYTSCLLTLTEGLGGAGNPELLTDPAEQTVQLPEGDEDGYHYKWISTVTGQVELTLKETSEETEDNTEEEPGTEETVPAKEPVPEILVTLGDQVYKLSDFEDGRLLFDTVKEQEVLIQVIAQPLPDGTYPAIDETILWNLLPAIGTAENPEPIESIASISVSLEAGDKWGHHYQWTAATDGDVTLTADKENLDVIVTMGQTILKLSESAEGNVKFHGDKDQTVTIQVVAIPETGEEGTESLVYPAVTGTVTGVILPDPGAPENPAVLESVETISVTLEAGDSDGFTGQWTARYGGTLEIAAESIPENLDVILKNTADDTAQRLSESETGLLCAEAEANDALTIQVLALPDEAGAYASGTVVLKGVFVADPGSSPENPIQIADPTSGESFAMEARQTLYFSGMVHEMVASVENAVGVTIHCGEETAWGDLTGTAQLELPEALSEEPVVFSVTSKNKKELTLKFAYPAGHARNPAQLALGESKVTLEENDTDGYLLSWTADCDGQLTVTVGGMGGWQYRLDQGAPGEIYTSVQEPVTASRTLEVKTGERVDLTLWTLAAETADTLPSGTLTVTASFFDPLLGTQAKPIRLENGSNSVTVPAGQSLYYAAQAEGMILTFAGQDVTLTHNGTEHLPENGTLELLCHGDKSLFCISNHAETDRTCKLDFAYPKGHRENPVPMVLGENTAVFTDGAISGCAFGWTAESAGQLTVSMTENAGWQYILSNESTGVTGVVHTSADQPRESSAVLEVDKGDRVILIVNTFDLEHPLCTPAGEVSFTAAFVDPTLGMEENPVWLNLEDEITIPAGKTMYCTAKADGMLLTLTGAGARVSHNGTDYLPEENKITLLCTGTGIFGHPVFAITNTGTADGVYSVSFTYPEGHFMAPAELKLEETTVDVKSAGKCGYYFCWTAKESGSFTFTMNTEAGWEYQITNLTTGEAGEIRTSDTEEPIRAETVQVSAGDRLRIQVSLPEDMAEEDAKKLSFTASFAPEQIGEA